MRRSQLVSFFDYRSGEKSETHWGNLEQIIGGIVSGGGRTAKDPDKALAIYDNSGSRLLEVYPNAD